MKLNLLIAGIALVTGGLIADSTVVSAAESPTKSDATLSVEQNDQPSEFKIEQTPNFKFTTKAGQVIPDGQIKGDADGMLVVTDTRGTGKGWGLSATLSEFKTKGAGESGWTMALGSIEMNPKVPSDIIEAPSTLSKNNNQLSPGAKSATPLITAQENTGMGSWQATFTNPILNVGNRLLPITGDRTATLTWPLSDAPITNPVAE